MGEPAKLALEDGTIFTGQAFGARGQTVGEAVFNTSMTGYQEVLTDPSYRGQIVCMTYPLIGNYGVTSDDQESARPQVSGFIVRELARYASNFRAEGGLENYLNRHGVQGIEGIDTRSLVRRLRVRGAMNGVLSTSMLEDASLVALARQAPGMLGRDLVREVVPEAPFVWTKGFEGALSSRLTPPQPLRHHVVAVDFGMKWNILRCLVHAGCKVTVVPGTASADDILAYKPDGVFLSNGPGDPAAVSYAIETVRRLVPKKPVFGICLGHQLLALALGAKTYKMKFGHRGVNQPVLDQRSGRVEITTQNHGFAVDTGTLPSDLEATHVNLNDRTLEGLRHRRWPVFSVQYHPEGSAGPHDSMHLFDDFSKLMA